MSTSIIERELADSPMVAVFKYVRFIVLFHLHDLIESRQGARFDDAC